MPTPSRPTAPDRSRITWPNGKRPCSPMVPAESTWPASLRAPAASSWVASSSSWRDLSPSRVQTFLAQLREQKALPAAIDPAKAEYTRKELAKLLAVSVNAITPMIRLHKLKATGESRARRYPKETVEALLAMRARGKSIKTSNGYLAAIKQFCHWLVSDRRAADNPFAHLSGGNVKMDRRHDRRALSSVELTSLLKPALGSGRTLRGLDSIGRYHLYLVAMTTGYRAGELASLTPEAFALDGPATINLAAGFTKNKRPASQPIPPLVSQALRGFLTGKTPGVPVWPGSWADDPVEMLRPDLDAAGIPYAIEGPDGPLFADFHALRHSYISLLDKAGATLKEAMQLARHSDPKLTMAVYGRASIADLAAAVEGLPLVSPDAAGNTNQPAGAIGLGNAYPKHEAGGGNVRIGEEKTRPALPGPEVQKPHEMKGNEAGRRRMRKGEEAPLH